METSFYPWKSLIWLLYSVVRIFLKIIAKIVFFFLKLRSEFFHRGSDFFLKNSLTPIFKIFCANNFGFKNPWLTSRYSAIVEFSQSMNRYRKHFAIIFTFVPVQWTKHAKMSSLWTTYKLPQTAPLSDYKTQIKIILKNFRYPFVN